MKKFRIESWEGGRYWGVTEVGETWFKNILVCLCVYKKGAEEVKKRFDEYEQELDQLRRKVDGGV